MQVQDDYFAASAQPLDKTQVEEFDLVILGGGTGSTVAAWTFAGEGKKVAVVDRKYIGGSCPNIACLPSKNIIHSAKVAWYVRHSKEFGITHDGTKRQLRGANVIVSTGTRASLETIPGLAEAQPLTHIEALELGEIPEHLLVVGAGYVGVEMSQAMRRFGSKVTMIDRNGRLMSKEDPDVCEVVRSLLTDEGIDVLLNARIKHVSGKCGDSVNVVVEQNGIEKVLKGSHVLVATGRTPNTEELGLELTGVELTDRGYIKVNERLQTTAPGVWAIGEVAGSPQFTHISVDDFRVVHANLTGGNRVTTGRQVPYCLFTDPELAHIGLSETQAAARGIPYRLFKVPMETNLRARTLSETRGFVKALVKADSDHLLGFTAFGVGAGETLAAVQMAMIAGLPYTALRDAVLIHPTLVEGLITLFSSAGVDALHRMR